MRARDMDRLGSLIRNINFSTMSDDDICDFLILSKIITDELESLTPAYKNEFQRRGIDNHANCDLGFKITTAKENNVNEVDVEKLYNTLELYDFLSIVNVVKSKATNQTQKAEIERNTKVIEKFGKVIKVSKISKKELVSFIQGGSHDDGSKPL